MAAPTTLAVMVFPGTQTLPLFAAQARGFFARRGLAVELVPAPNSDEQRSGLAAGRYPIVHGAADQAVALVEGGVDAMVVAGGDCRRRPSGAPSATATTRSRSPSARSARRC